MNSSEQFVALNTFFFHNLFQPQIFLLSLFLHTHNSSKTSHISLTIHKTSANNIFQKRMGYPFVFQNFPIFLADFCDKTTVFSYKTIVCGYKSQFFVADFCDKNGVSQKKTANLIFLVFFSAMDPKSVEDLWKSYVMANVVLLEKKKIELYQEVLQNILDCQFHNIIKVNLLMFSFHQLQNFKGS